MPPPPASRRPAGLPLLGLAFLCLVHAACGGAGAATEALKPAPPSVTPPPVAPPPPPVPDVPPPVVTSPIVTSPVITSPVVTSPVVTSPVVTSPVVTSPVVTSPVVTSPVVTPPVVTSPVEPSSVTPPAPEPVLPLPSLAPVIEDFHLEPGTVFSGGQATLRATFHGGTGRVDPGVGMVASGTPVMVNAASSTAFTLTVTGSGGQTVHRTVTLKVVPPSALPITAPERVQAGAEGAVAFLPEVPGVAYAWSIQNGELTTDPHQAKVGFKAHRPGTAMLVCQVSDSQGRFDAPATWEVVVDEAAPPPRVALPGHVTAGQAGYHASVVLPPGATCAWTLVGGGTLTSDPLAPTVTFTAGVHGSVELRCRILDPSGTETAVVQAVAQVVPVPGPVLITAPATGEADRALQATVTAQSGCSFRWSLTNGTLEGAPTGTSITFRPAGSGPTGLTCCAVNAAGTPGPLATHIIQPAPREERLPAGLYLGQGPSKEAVRVLLLADGRFWATVQSAYHADGDATLIQGHIRREAGSLQASLALHPLSGPATDLTRPLEILSLAPAPRIRIALPLDGVEASVDLERLAPLEAPGSLPRFRGRFQGPILASRQRRPAGTAPPTLTLDLDTPGTFTGLVTFDPSMARATIPVHGTWKAGTGSEAHALTLDLQGEDPLLTSLLGAQACQVLGVYDGETRRLRLASLAKGTPWAAACLGPFGSGDAPFDAERDVLPFDSVRVPHWPGLLNVGGSCYVNVTLKLLAATADLDPFLLETPGDDRATANLRGALRALVTFIRSGSEHLRPHGRNARELLEGVLDALRHHPITAPTVTQIGSGGGGNDFQVLAVIQRALGLGEEFKGTIIRKEIFLDPSTTKNSWGPSPWNTLISSQDPLVSRVDPALPYTLATLFREHVGKPWVFQDQILTRLPTFLPRNMIVHLLPVAPVDPLGFSEEVELPVFDVDRASGNETRWRTVRMKVVAIAQSTPAHVWAMIRGDNRWYKNDDNHPVHPVPDAHLDETAGAPGDLAMAIVTVLLRRVDP